MSTLAHEHDSGHENTATVELALEQKRAAIEGALKDAPQGRHAQERATLHAAQEQLTGRCNGDVRDEVDAFFAMQRGQLEKLQHSELDTVNSALDAAKSNGQSPDAQRDALRMLEREVDAAGAIHREQHARLARERADLETALAVENDQLQSQLIADLRRLQDQADAVLRDTLDSARAFAERPGKTWSNAEEAERTAAGAADQLRAAPRSTEEADNPNSHKRGNFGERAATDWLAANGYDILNYKPAIEETTKPGIDMIAMKGDTVYFLDNKALSRDGDVNSVSALTTNFEDRDGKEGNLSKAQRALQEMATDTARTAEQIAIARKALDALEAERYVRAVTNANVARDDRILSDVAERLKEQYDIQFIDVMKGRKA
jgi:hypothetical protein